MLSTAIVTVALSLAAGSTGWPGPPLETSRQERIRTIFSLGHPGMRIVPPGPGYGWGFPNGNPDGYGWVNYGTDLPLGADRTADYFFPHYYALPASQSLLPSYSNPYVTRGQRYLAYAGCGGCHPAGGPAIGNAQTPSRPYTAHTVSSGARSPLSPFTGRVEAPPISAGGTGLTP